jgi:hypothetical protein
LHGRGREEKRREREREREIERERERESAKDRERSKVIEREYIFAFGLTARVSPMADSCGYTSWPLTQLGLQELTVAGSDLSGIRTRDHGISSLCSN